MGTFTIASPDGKSYTIEGDNAEGALSALKKHLGQEQPVSTIADAAKSAGIGVVKGGIGLAGMAGDLSDLGAKGLEHASNYISDKLGMERYKRPEQPSILDNLPTSASIQKRVEGQTGEFYKPKTTAGEYAQTAGEFLPGLIGGPEGLASKFLTRVAAPAVMSETAGQLTKDTAAEPWARIAGGLLSPAAVAGVEGGARLLAAPAVSNYRAWKDPAGVAESQLARALMNSGKSAPEVEAGVSNARAAGQTQYTNADELGNAGQRLLSSVARAPGEGRQHTVDFLEGRQAGQGGSIADILEQGLGTSGTARQTSDALTKTARTESAPYYEKALANKPVWNERIQQFFDDPVTKQGLKEGVAVQRLESLAEGKKFDPQDYAITHFNEAGDPVLSGVPNMRTINLIKKGWDNTLEGYRDSTTGKLMLDEKGRALDAVRRSFLKEIDAVNPDYAKARSLYAGPSQVKDAIYFGGAAAKGGRASDNLKQFDGLSDPSKQGYREGYADKLIGKMEFGAHGVDKSRQFTSDKSRAELPALSLYQGPLQPGKGDLLSQNLARERTMFETRRQATGGSGTAENLADGEAMHVDPSIVRSMMHGKFLAAGMHAVQAVGRGMTGNTPEVRAHLAKLLLSDTKLAPIVDRVGTKTSASRHLTAERAMLAALLSNGSHDRGQ